MRIAPVDASSRTDWLRLRAMLWPDAGEGDAAGRNPVWVALDGARVVGFAEASLRHDYTNGCDRSPVVFLEGIFVLPDARSRGAGRALSDAVAAWGRQAGALDYASDAPIDAIDSRRFHAALGFVETEQVVFFRKDLPR